MKRNSLNIFVSLIAIVFSLVSMPALAQPQLKIATIANSVLPTVTIPITTTNFIQLLAIQGSINWDNTKLTYNSVTNINAQLSGSSFGNSVSGSTGRFSYIWTDANLIAQTITNDAVLFNLVLNLVPSAVGTVSLSFSNTPTALLIADNNLATVTGVVYTPGTVTIPWALPATLNQFSAIKNNNAITVKWTTIEEKNTAYFEIEKSTNCTNFVAINKTNAASNSSLPQQYSFIDATVNVLVNPIVYYRLKITDLNGRYTFSKIISIKNGDKAGSLIVYPNPVKQNLNVQAKSNITEQATAQITDLVGRVVLEQKIQLNAGATSFSLSVSGLVAGNYLLVLKGTSTIGYQKIIKE